MIALTEEIFFIFRSFRERLLDLLEKGFVVSYELARFLPGVNLDPTLCLSKRMWEESDLESAGPHDVSIEVVSEVACTKLFLDVVDRVENVPSEASPPAVLDFD